MTLESRLLLDALCESGGAQRRTQINSSTDEPLTDPLRSFAKMPPRCDRRQYGRSHEVSYPICNRRTLQTMKSSNALLSLVSGMALFSALGSHSLAIAEPTGTDAPHTCVAVAPGDIRSEFGCFRIGMVENLKFSRSTVYWHLYSFPSRTAADAARSSSGIVVEEDGRVWLSEFGARNIQIRGGTRVAVVGPLKLAPADRYDAEIAYPVMRPSDYSRVHTHSGPEAWYVLTGVQCLETPELTRSAGPGTTMTATANRPMELRVVGTDVARSLTLVIHDSTQEFGKASDWKPTGRVAPDAARRGSTPRLPRATTAHGPNSVSRERLLVVTHIATPKDPLQPFLQYRPPLSNELGGRAGHC